MLKDDAVMVMHAQEHDVNRQAALMPQGDDNGVGWQAHKENVAKEEPGVSESRSDEPGVEVELAELGL